MPFNFPNNPALGQISTQNNRVYKWGGYSWDLLDGDSNLTFAVLVIGGGGGGGATVANNRGGGGGGGGGAIETNLFNIILNESYIVRVGAGGASGFIGNFSRFGHIMAVGGGGSGGTTYFNMATGAGSLTGRQGSIFAHQGFSGGTGLSGSGGGGGGAGGQGGDATSTDAGSGGVGFLSNTTTVTPTYYGGGGGGGGKNLSGNASNPGVGGLGGGGNAGATSPFNGNAGTANTGGGGGGGTAISSNNTTGGAGGSGIIILRFNAGLTITLSAGLSYSVAFVDTDEIVTITGGTGTVTFTV